MFVGPLGKQMMIEQGYVPETCTMPVEIAGPLIYDEVKAGRDVCAGCNDDRAVCEGRPRIRLGEGSAHCSPATALIESCALPRLLMRAHARLNEVGRHRT